MTGWLEYTAEGLLAALGKARDRIQAISAESGPEPILLRPRQEQLQRMLRDEGPPAPRLIWEGPGVSRQGAMDLLRPLLAAGLEKRIGRKKSGKYTPTYVYLPDLFQKNSSRTLRPGLSGGGFAGGAAPPRCGVSRPRGAGR